MRSNAGRCNARSDRYLPVDSTIESGVQFGVRILLLFCFAFSSSGCLTWTTFEPVDQSQPDSGQNDVREDPEWWDESWPLRRRIVIPSGLTSGSLSDVPIMVPLTIETPVRFVSRDVELSFERAGDQFWVKVPSVDSAGATFYVYYGKEDAEITEAADVWSNGYVAVWHFDEELVDSEAGGQPYYEDSVGGLRIVQNDAFESSFLAPGYLGQCLHIRDAIESDFEAVGLGAVFPDAEMTFELWYNMQFAGQTSRRIFGAGDPAFIVEMRDGGIQVSARGDSGRSVSWTPTYDTWAKMTVTLGAIDPRRNISVYLDDDDPLQSPPLSIDWRPTNQFFLIGTQSTLDFRYDELRISNVERSEAWVRFQAKVESQPSPVMIESEEVR